MTLCAVWIRHGQSDEGQELVFATDSRLRMGEAWDMGLKLFNLGRSDCQFVLKCYPQKKLDPALPEAHRNRLKRILRDVAYREFVARREEAATSAAAATLQEQGAESADEPPADQEV
jgi:hypothetical protein